MSITDLCGSLKSFSDLKKHPVKNRYTESTEVKSNAGAWFRMILSRHSDSNGPWFLDARKCFLRFKVRITEVGTQKSWIDGPTAAVLFDRTKLSAAALSSAISRITRFSPRCKKTYTTLMRRNLRLSVVCAVTGLSRSARHGGCRTPKNTSLMPRLWAHF